MDYYIDTSTAKPKHVLFTFLFFYKDEGHPGWCPDYGLSSVLSQLHISSVTQPYPTNIITHGSWPNTAFRTSPPIILFTIVPRDPSEVFKNVCAFHPLSLLCHTTSSFEQKSCLNFNSNLLWPLLFALCILLYEWNETWEWHIYEDYSVHIVDEFITKI